MPQDNKNFPHNQPGKNPGQNPGQRPQQNPGKPNPGQNPNWGTGGKPGQGKPQGYAEQKPGAAGVWSPKDIETLKTLAQANTPVDTIASKLGKTEDVIQAKAQELNLQLESW